MVDGDTYYGDSSDNYYIGSPIGDLLDGRAGADTLEGSSGNDTIMPGFGDGSPDWLIGGDGDDVLYADEFDRLEGGNGFDTANFRKLTSGITTSYGMVDYLYLETNSSAIHVQGVEKFILTDFADRLDASYLYTDVTIQGGGGADNLNGSIGNTVFLARSGDNLDSFYGNGNFDTRAVSTRTDSVGIPFAAAL